MSKAQANPRAGWTLERFLPWLLIFGGLVALIASVMLATEVFDRLKDPNYTPVCNLNPILSCTNVADSAQAHAFGFPNYFIGIAGYAMVAGLGVAMLAGARFKTWFWRLVEAGMLFAFGFITWLQFQTLYRIGALCIFCMIVWAMTGPLFWYTTLYNLGAGHAPKRFTSKFARAINLARRHHTDILVLWFVIIIALILKRFWYYWSTL